MRGRKETVLRAPLQSLPSAEEAVREETGDAALNFLSPCSVFSSHCPRVPTRSSRDETKRSRYLKGSNTMIYKAKSVKQVPKTV